MSDFDPIVDRELQRLVPATRALPDWRDVVDRLRPPLWRRPLVLALAAAFVVLATGAGVTAALGGFDHWLVGKPGRPAAPGDQALFRAANGRSWASFPVGTKLRQLIDTTVGGRRYVLFGFRSGNELCLQLKAVTLGRLLTPICTPASMLAHLEAPIRIVDPDETLVSGGGRPDAEYSYGIVADGVRRVDVRATDGTHRASVGGNAYLWVENDPNTGNHARQVVATGASGRTSLAVFGSDLLAPTPAPALPPGPTSVQALIAHPRIAWIDRHERRGLSVGQARLTPQQRRELSINQATGEATRLIKPDPLSNVVFGVSFGLRGTLCLTVLEGNGLLDNGGCGASPFELGPVTMQGEGRGNTFLITGAAADGVARIEIFLADGERARAALLDNMFTALVPGWGPVRVVGYDVSGRVVFTQLYGGGGNTVPAGALRQLRDVITVHAPNGAVGTMANGRPLGWSRCWRARYSTGQRQTECPSVTGNADAVYVQPAGRDVFVLGTIRPPVVRARLRFPDGSEVAADPVQSLFLVAVPRAHLSRTRQAALLIGYDATGKVVPLGTVYFRANG